MGSSKVDSTTILFASARDGDSAARNRLAARYVAPLRNWAYERFGGAPCDLLDMEDLVQAALFRGVSRLRQIDLRGGTAFLGYLQRIVLNQFRDQARRMKRHPKEPLADDLAANGASPLDEVLRRERYDVYQRGLAKLTRAQREAVVLRFEYGLRYATIAVRMRLPSPDAARALASRGVVRLKKLSGGYFHD